MKILLTALLLLPFALSAQSDSPGSPFDTWSVYTSHRNVVQVGPLGPGNGATVVARTTGGFVLYNHQTGSRTTFNTNDGKYRTEATSMEVDRANNTIWFGYADGTLSVFDVQTFRFRHFNDISRNDRFLSNRINTLTLSGNTLYVGTDFGLVLFDVRTRVVIDSYTLFGNFPSGTAVLDVSVDGDMFYLGTSAGVAAGNRSTADLKLAQSWQVFQTELFFGGEPVQVIASSSGGLVAVTPSGNFRRANGVWSAFDIPGGLPIRSVSAGAEPVRIVTSGGRALQWNTDAFTFIELYNAPFGTLLNSAVILEGGILLGGSNNRGIVQRNQTQDETVFIEPNGPSHNLFEEFLVAPNGDVIGTSSPTPGRFNIGFNDTGFYLFRDGTWTNYNILTNATIQQLNINSFYTAAVSGAHYFFGTWGRGFVRYDVDTGEITRYNTSNTGLPGFTDGSSFMVVSGLSADQTDPDAIWVISRTTSNTPLGRYSIANRTVETFNRLPQMPSDSRYADLITDSFGQLWVALENNAEAGRGLMVIRDPAAGAEGAFRLTSADDSGGLPNEKINAIVQDRRGEVWVGTDRGIGRFLFPDRIINGSPLERRAQPLISADTSAFDRVLLRNVRVTALAVDANNQKWVGTDGDGVYLIEESGRAILRQFTTANSPMTSNTVKSLAINTQTGELYIAAENGFMVYTTLEREATASMQQLHVFPNPYSYERNHGEPIVLEGLTDNTTVSILTVDGRLVRRFTTRGGRTTWDGLDASGNRVATGVYFIVANENSGNQVGRARLVMVR